jgi:GTP cyclohydrolase FolE2
MASMQENVTQIKGNEEVEDAMGRRLQMNKNRIRIGAEVGVRTQVITKCRSAQDMSKKLLLREMCRVRPQTWARRFG